MHQNASVTQAFKLRLLDFVRRPGVLGAIEQSVQSATHFLLAILVFRWHGELSFSGYSFGYALLLLGYAVVSSTIVEPYSVLKGNKAAPIVLVGALMGGVLGLGAYVADGALLQSVEQNGWPLISAVSLSAAYWAQKAKFYQSGRAGLVLAGSLVYSCIVLGTYTGGSQNAFLSISYAAGVVSFGTLVSEVLSAKFGEIPAYLRAVRIYALWALLAACATWAINNIYFVVLPIAGRSETAAALRATLNLVVPVNTLVVGATTAMLPRLAELYQREGADSLKSLTSRSLVMTVSAASFLAVGLAVGGQSLLRVVYGVAGEEYASMMMAVALLPIVWSATLVVRASMRAAAMTREIFFSYAMAAAFGIPITLISISQSDVAISIGAVVLQMAVMIAMFRYFFSIHSKSVVS
jgi:O-antigen/teichoic acid export membrane protein